MGLQLVSTHLQVTVVITCVPAVFTGTHIAYIVSERVLISVQMCPPPSGLQRESK